MNKKKFKFTDLSDDEVDEINLNMDNSTNSLNDFKIDVNKVPVNIDEKNNFSINSEVIKKTSENHLEIGNQEIQKIERIVPDQFNTVEPEKSTFIEQNKERSFNKVSQLKTFNESVKANFNEDFKLSFKEEKLNNFFVQKERLDIKTNIYLKQKLVEQINYLSKKLGESRSLVINKLIEHALKDIIS